MTKFLSNFLAGFPGGVSHRAGRIAARRAGLSRYPIFLTFCNILERFCNWFLTFLPDWAGLHGYRWAGVPDCKIMESC